jgi:rhamnose utilization protein RhaD (predicted bifunctional aldolase and dehydrogenase)/NAD(P)-dependent dehydrogenase (short-subunit alcohol dehydrogenase family)
MKNLWSDAEAKKYVRKYAPGGVNRDLALRVYTSRLLGGDPKLVLHGGGNTSVKTSMKDVAGDVVDVLCVKGSGWDLSDIEPAGLPAVRLELLRRLKKLKRLSDEDMVNVQRTGLLDSTSPNPSVETLLHAFLPHKFVDHTHSNAVLALTDQVEGEKICRDLYGNSMAYVPYIMPGFDLAQEADRVFRQNPDVEGLILLKHGIFTFGGTAKESYGRMIKYVSAAERELKKHRKKKIFPGAALPKKIASVAEIAPLLRGLVAEDLGGGEWKRMVMDFRASPAVKAFVNGGDVARYACQGVATPDHAIRTKPKPLIVAPPEAGNLDVFAKSAEKALKKYSRAYRAYFARNNSRFRPSKSELDPMPRVILVPGLGLFGLGANAKAAAVAADLAEANVAVITAAESMSAYKVIPERDIFAIEYWGLEQAKLGRGVELPLARRVCVVTGGASGIGAATVMAFRNSGAEVAVLDRDAAAADLLAAEIGGFGVACDVTDRKSVGRAFDAVAARFGGVDILVSNAGAAWQGRIGEVDEETLKASFDLNFWGHQWVAQAATRIMLAQGTGGCLLFNTSKQAINPGPGFGPYGLAKAATLFLMRQYAVDHGRDGIRSNAVNADRIRSGLLTAAMIESRSQARGVSQADYMAGNLLGLEVTAEDVARAFVDLALASKTTGAVLTVDGGNIAAAPR